jgi:hypothetical protein
MDSRPVPGVYGLWTTCRRNAQIVRLNRGSNPTAMIALLERPGAMGSQAGIFWRGRNLTVRDAHGVANCSKNRLRQHITRSAMASTSQLTLVGWPGVARWVRMTERYQQITRPLITSSAVLSNPYLEIGPPSLTAGRDNQCNKWNGSARKPCVVHVHVPGIMPRPTGLLSIWPPSWRSGVRPQSGE